MPALLIATSMQDAQLSEQAREAMRSLLVPPVVQDVGCEPVTAARKIQELRPHVVIADLVSLGQDFAGTIRAMRAMPNPPTVAVLHGAAEAGAILACMRAGAAEFIYAPITGGLARMLSEVEARQAEEGKSAPTGGRVLTVLGVKGGCGATTLACHAALALKEASNVSTLLVDLDWNSAACTFLLRANPKYSLLDALSSADRMDGILSDTLVTQTASGIALAAAPIEHSSVEAVGAAQLRSLLRFWRTRYAYSVIDGGVGFGAAVQACVEEADDVVVVTTAEITALHGARRVLTALKAKPGMDGRVRLVLNRARKRGENETREIEGLLNHRVHSAIPDDSAALNNAYREGRLLRQDEDLYRGIAAFANRLAGIGLNEPVAAKRRFSLLSMR